MFCVPSNRFPSNTRCSYKASPKRLQSVLCCAVRCIITHPTANKVKGNHIRSADIQFELENRFRNYNFFLHWCVLVRTYLDLDFMIIKKQQEKMNIFRMKAIFFRSENVRQNAFDDILVPLEMQIYISHELL